MDHQNRKLRSLLSIRFLPNMEEQKEVSRLSSIEIISAEDLAAMPLAPPLFVVDGLIPQGVSLLSGASKTGKSWLMLRLGLQVSQGLPLWDLPTHRCGVLYLSLENTHIRLQRRLFQLSEATPPNLYFSVTADTIQGGLETDLEKNLREHPDVKLVICDTLQKIRAGETPDANGLYAGDYEDISTLKRIADRHGIAIILIHHLRKQTDRKDPFNRISGSSGLMGAADTCFVLDKPTQASDTATLHATGRDIESQELELRFSNCVWELLERRDEQTLRQDTIPPFLFQVVDFMQTRSRWEGTATELLEALEETEVKPQGVLRLLGRFYYEVLYSHGIQYQSRRTAQSRLIMLTRDGANDDKDEAGVSREMTSLSSQSSQKRDGPFANDPALTAQS